MKKNKYDYYKVIQEKTGCGWDDVDPHECNSTGRMEPKARAALKENLRLYRENGSGSYRVVFKRELLPDLETFREYFNSFYGVNGVYPIKDTSLEAITKAVKKIENFTGDSIDREKARDFIFTPEELKKAFPSR